MGLRCHQASGGLHVGREAARGSVRRRPPRETSSLQNITYFPQPSAVDCRTPSANHLRNVGLPHSEVFISREEVPNPYPGKLDDITLESRFAYLGTPYISESRKWRVLGYLFESLIAMDPESGKIYVISGGEAGYTELHRDVESLLFALVEFRRLEVDHDNDVDPEELSARFRQVVGGFDSTPFADEDSPWNLSLEELEHGIW